MWIESGWVGSTGFRICIKTTETITVSCNLSHTGSNNAVGPPSQRSAIAKILGLGLGLGPGILIIAAVLLQTLKPVIYYFLAVAKPLIYAFFDTVVLLCRKQTVLMSS